MCFTSWSLSAWPKMVYLWLCTFLIFGIQKQWVMSLLVNKHSYFSWLHMSKLKPNTDLHNIIYFNKQRINNSQNPSVIHMWSLLILQVEKLMMNQFRIYPVYLALTVRCDLPAVCLSLLSEVQTLKSFTILNVMVGLTKKGILSIIVM